MTMHKCPFLGAVPHLVCLAAVSFRVVCTVPMEVGCQIHQLLEPAQRDDSRCCVLILAICLYLNAMGRV
jgi:hypothetical protein